ncbi:MAG TPA: hypothetical protein DIV54_10175 [Verrucomicrobiales bacterium]|nr:hypothetical protein [Roseibacillus sp.]HCQ33855.1 hypothetical protein [Verrucomicrobiales bacterium]
MFAEFLLWQREEALKHIRAGGFENLHLSCYREVNLGGDNVWDVWQPESPSMVSYFRGLPHVPTGLNIRETA